MDQAQVEREQLRHWVDTWRRAGEELDEIRRREIQSLTDEGTREAIRQLFGTGESIDTVPPRTTSGLVEQQAWFNRVQGVTIA